MLDGVMLLWFVLTALSVLYVGLDIRSTPESPVLKWGFVLLTAYTGPIGAFLYVLGCREPLPGLHERYTAARWRQVLGSTMHCVAGDGIGILAGAVIAASVELSGYGDVALEYVLGFAFGWSIFQSLFMRGMAGGSYTRALAGTFFSELLSMNCLMAGMVPVMTVAMAHVPGGRDPSHPAFWFVMSMALLIGFVTAYPMNWWLVARHLKHGMMTVRASVERADGASAHASGTGHHHMSGDRLDHDNVSAPHPDGRSVTTAALAGMTVLSVGIFALGLVLAMFLGGL
ncbi:DUF4396 domain-containing protein [Salinisphaera sp. LB1]|uniref:DUF4396 domain-containing protein n=1 Tax=Salinisphaera sp. LB1 TaxID=2183911 RepID=UPI000D705954|nr:DUF4396 domain-containing protein [Salinisphaera sp. LB1]AWN14459.1 Multicopper oxidase [Salinisphaera sp. LB1]